MNKENKADQPLLIFLITLILLLLLSLQASDFNIGGVQIRKVDVLSDVRSDQ